MIKSKINYKLIIIPLIITIIFVLYSKNIVNKYIIQLLMLCGINIIMTQSVNLVNGLTGQSTMGHAGFMSVGAYASAFITTVLFPVSNFSYGIQMIMFLLATIFGGCVAALFGIAIGGPSLRLKGDYLAILSLGFGEVIRTLLRATSILGGARGLTGIPKLAGLFWVYLFVALTIYVCRNFMDSSYGRACIAIRDNDIAADAMGINTSRYKIIAFVLSTFLAGIAGSLYAHVFRFLQPDVFGYAKSTDFLVYLYAGGVGSISGSIVGAFVLTILPELLRSVAEFRLVFYGALLVAIILFKPSGLFGGREFAFLKLNTGGIKEIGLKNFKLNIKNKNKSDFINKGEDYEKHT